MPLSTDSLPIFLSDFTAYHFSVRFRAERAIAFERKWYFMPRFALGNALKNSKRYAYLYGQIFKPQEEDTDESKGSGNTSRLIIRADKPSRKSLEAGEAMDLYITVVTRDPLLVGDFLSFLPEWQAYNFFRENDLTYDSYRLYNPTTQKYESGLRVEDAALTVDFFSRQAIRWGEILSVRFLSPASIKVDQILSAEIPYSRLMNRLSRRLYELYTQYLSRGETSVERYIFPDHDGLIYSQISMPRKATIKENRQYDMSGILGQLFYRVPYDPVAALMLSMAHWVHIGNHTIVGNGQIESTPGNDTLYRKWLSSLAADRDLPMEEAERQDLLEALRICSYIPQPYHSVNIPKGDGSYRQLHIPSAVDLHLQRSLAVILYPITESLSIAQSYAYRKGKGAVAAVRRVQHLLDSLDENHTVVRCDIDNFFDSIPVPSLLQKVQRTTEDPLLTRMLSLWMKSGVVDRKQQYAPASSGIPQGSPLAPLLSNLYLEDTDRYIAGHITTEFIRYADDLLLFLPEKVDPLNALQDLSEHLKYRKGLKLNRDFVVSSIKSSFSFLGITFCADGSRSMSRDKKEGLKRKITLALHRDTENFSALSETIHGMEQYYRKLLEKVDIEAIDEVAATVYATHIASLPTSEARKSAKDNLLRLGFLSSETAKQTLREAMRQTVVSSADNFPIKKESEILREQQKRQLQERGEIFDLVVTEPGAFIGISRNHVLVRKYGKTICKQPAAQIEQISIISDGVSLSSNVTKYCRKKNIRVIFYNATGQAYASLNGMNTILPSVMEAQMRLSEEKKREFILTLIKNKVRNQGKLLRYYHKYYRHDKELKEPLSNAIAELKQLEGIPIAEGSSLADFRQHAMLHEARCAQVYWRAFALLVHRSGHEFEGREHKGAEGLVNQMLNYGYAILRSYVMKTIDLWQLNPNIGILHSTQDNKPALCFDLMEQYRAFVVDRSILALLAKGEDVGQNNKGLLDMPTRSRIISKINERWFATEYYRSGEKLFSDIMKLQTKDVRAFCCGKVKRIKFYTPKW